MVLLIDPLEVNAGTDVRRDVNEDDNDEHAGTSETKTSQSPCCSYILKDHLQLRPELEFVSGLKSCGARRMS